MAAVPALAATLAGCGASDAPIPQRTVTVTQSTGPMPTSTDTPTASSDVRGRAHDVGSIASVSTVGGVRVLDVDRWSATGVSDSTVARDGIPVAPHEGARYTNQNTRKTYTVPVAPSVMVVVNVCTPARTASWV